MLFSRLLSIFLLLTVVPAFALQISAPERAENGAVIPVTIKFDKPLLAGQQLDLLVNGEVAAQVRVVSGKLSDFKTRIKGSKDPTTIIARVLANGSELDSASRNTNVTITAAVEGSPTVGIIDKARSAPGEIKLLIKSVNGYAGVLFLQDAGFQVEISGSAIISMNPFVSVSGEFSDQVSASFIAQSSVALAEARTKRIAEVVETKRKDDETKAKQLSDENTAKNKRITEEAEAKRLEVIKGLAREKDRDVAADEQRERDEIDAKEKQKAEKAFKASLKKLNAGELYALADKKRHAGELDQVREILETLITKFPNNPLVAIAAQQLTQLPPPTTAAEPSMTIPPAPASQKKPSNRDAGLEEMNEAFSKSKK